MSSCLSDTEKELCFTDHNSTKLDPAHRQCNFSDENHSPGTHAYNGDSANVFLLEVTSSAMNQGAYQGA